MAYFREIYLAKLLQALVAKGDQSLLALLQEIITSTTIVEPALTQNDTLPLLLNVRAEIGIDPNIILAAQPTRGVDIGSKREIYRLLREYAAEGNAIVIYCTEVSEVFDAADVVHVVTDGHLSRPLLVRAHEEIHELAAEITRLERHGRPVPPGSDAPMTASA